MLKTNVEAQTTETIVHKTTWLGFRSAQVFTRRRGASQGPSVPTETNAAQDQRDKKCRELEIRIDPLHSHSNTDPYDPSLPVASAAEAPSTSRSPEQLKKPSETRTNAVGSAVRTRHKRLTSKHAHKQPHKISP